MLQLAQRVSKSDPARALLLCSQHAAQFPNGILGQEREVIAIEALLALGRGGEAAARAEAFEAHYPGSAHARRLRALVENRGAP
jgi:hypothetical protein